MAVSKNNVRMTIAMTPKVKKYFEDKSLETGVSQSSLISLALNEYIEQKNVVEVMQEFITKIESVNGSAE